MAKRKKKKALPGEGSYMEFHGAFNSEADAQKRARARGGFFARRRIRGKRRVVVMVPKSSPF